MKNLWILGLSAILGLAACGEQKAAQQQSPAPVALMSENKANSGEAEKAVSDNEQEVEKPKKAKKSAENTIPAEPVDINTATADELIAALKGTGVGKAKVAKIIEYREQNKGFKSIEELNEVKGIGEKTLEKMRSRIKITSTGTSEPKKAAAITETEQK